MNRPELTATVARCVTVDPRDDLNLYQNVRVRVADYGDAAKPLHIAFYEDAAGKQLQDPPPHMVMYRTAESALAGAVADLFVHANARLQEAIAGEPSDG